MQTRGVLASPVAGIGAESAVVQLGRPGGLDKGRVVEVLGLASALLPDEEPLVARQYLVGPVRYKGQGLIPGDLPPFAGHSLSIGSDQRGLHPVGIINGHDLGKALGAQRAAVARVLWKTLDVDQSPVDPAGPDATVLLADPAGRGHPLVGCGGRLIWRRGN